MREARLKMPIKTIFATKLHVPIIRLYFTIEQIGAKFDIITLSPKFLP